MREIECFLRNLEYRDIILDLMGDNSSQESLRKIARLQSELSAVLTLYGGDVSFTPATFSVPIRGMKAHYEPGEAGLSPSPSILVDHPIAVAFHETMLGMTTREAEKDILFFLPETITKPFTQSSSFKIVSGKLSEVLGSEYDRIDFVFISCFLGPVPAKYDDVFPATLKLANSEFSGTLVGKLSERIARFLSKTETYYTARYAFLRGSYRKIMEQAIKRTGINVKMLITEEVERKLKKEGYAWVKQGIRHKKALRLLEEEFGEAIKVEKQRMLTDDNFNKRED